MKKVLAMMVLVGALALTGCMTKMVIGQAEPLAKQRGWMQLPSTGGGTVWLGPEMAKHYRIKQAEAKALYVSAVDRKEVLSALLAMDDYMKADPAHGIDEYQMADNLLPIRMMFARGFDYILLPGGIAYGLYEAADSLSSGGSEGRYKTVEVTATQGDNSRVNIQTGNESGYKEGPGFNTNNAGEGVSNNSGN